MYELKKADLQHIVKAKGWNFDWALEKARLGTQVYKLVVKNDTGIRGLISHGKPRRPFYLPLIESAPHNRGKGKKYFGVPGNLTAFAVKRAFEYGYEGAVVFVAKSKLIEHYEKSLNASVLVGMRMTFSESAARNLVSLYFKDFIVP